MYLRFFFSLFFSAKALAVPSGEIFWEVVKPGVSTPNYLLGTYHSLKLHEDSLPPELKVAIKDSTIGLFEIISSERTDTMKAEERIVRLPAGETLSSYIGEGRTQRLFSAFQFAISQLSEEGVSFLSDKWKEFDLDITSYRDFNKLPPLKVFTFKDLVLQARGDRAIPIVPSNLFERKRDYLSDSKTDIKECFLQKDPQMDNYMEKIFSCQGKPVYSLETADEQIQLGSFVNNKIVAKELVWDSERIIRHLQGHSSPEDDLYEEWRSFVIRVRRTVGKDTGREFYLNEPLNTAFLTFDITRAISEFLKQKKCSFFSESSISQYIEDLIEEYQWGERIMAEGKKIRKAIEKQYIGITDKTIRGEIEIFSLCFPDFPWPENLEEMIKRSNQLMLENMSRHIEIHLLLRDITQVQNMLPYFEKGGAFTAVGYSHLTGLLRELKTRGYEVKRIDFSTPFKFPLTPSLYEQVKKEGEYKYEKVRRRPTYDPIERN